MDKNPEYDAVIVGSGPNGFSAAITLAREGLKTVLLEAKNEIGGGVRSGLLKGKNIYDNCSAVHPLAIASPVFNSMPLERFGLKWIFPEINLAHPLDDGSAAFLSQSISDFKKDFSEDESFFNFLNGLIENPASLNYFFNPLKFSGSLLSKIKFAGNALRSAENFVGRTIKNEKLKSLFIGNAAHSGAKLNSPATSAVGIFLILLAYKNGWGFPKGGAQELTEALAAYFRSLGGKIITDLEVKNAADIPTAKIVLLDLTPKQILKIMDERLPHLYKKQLKKFEYGPGSFKVDFLIEDEIPFTNSETGKAGTVHLGGSFQEIIAAEEKVFGGGIPEKPFVILSQQSKFDSSRAEDGKNVVWSYCHVPNNSGVDMTDKIESQIERFAPGFKEKIISKKITSASGLENYNSNYIGGDINGGLFAWNQLLTRPAVKINPYKIPVEGFYICSSSTPPGGGVHGVCGYNAALSALKIAKL